MLTISIPSADIIRHFADLAKHFLSSIVADPSFGGEYEHLRKLCDTLDIKKGFIVDVAASDGVDQSCTLGFFKDPDWNGLAVEMEPLKFARLAFLHSNFPNAKLARSRVTPLNITALLQGFEVPSDFSVLNLDIDSYDLDVVNAMLKSGFKPKIISMEINEKIPPPLYFNVNFTPSHVWQTDHFFGCSLTAAAHVVRAHGYILESLQYNNAVFVRADLAKGKFEDQPVAAAYDAGYRNKPDRAKLFPWNADMDCLLGYSPEQAVEFVNTYFKKYAGKYTLHI
jgi:hypothetical protein